MNDTLWTITDLEGVSKVKGIRAYKKCFLAFPLVVLMNINCLKRQEPGDFSGTLNDLFLSNLFGKQGTENPGRFLLVLSFMSMAFVLIFAILCGMEIYRELFGTGIYTLIRVKNKEKWITSLVFGLMKKTLVFSVLYSITTLVAEQYKTQLPMDENTVFALFLSIMFVFMATYFIALAINYFSICYNTSIGSLGGGLLLLVLVVEALFHKKIPWFGTMENTYYLNPLSMINLFYDTNKWKVVAFLLYYMVLLVLISVGFVRQVVKKDIKLLAEDV